MAFRTADNLFGRTFDCECGRTHTIIPRRVIYAEDALSRLPGLCAPLAPRRRALVIMDTRTRDAAGQEALDHLAAAGWDMTVRQIPDRPDGRTPVCDEATRRTLDGQGLTVEIVICIGSGVLSDLGKWLAFDENRPYLSVPTACSMNGYASANVAPTIDGVKSLLRARPPDLIAASPTVLRDAPCQMTAAGLGDVLAKSVSSTDWYLNHLLFGDYYCRRSVELVAEVEPLYLDDPEAIRNRRPEAIEALFEALLLTGAAMTMAETSAPASGGEHMISHALDMLGSLDGSGHDLHGRQVGLGAILTSELYRRVLDIDRPAFRVPDEAVNNKLWRDLTAAVAHQYDQKRPRLRAAAEALARPGRWDELRAALAPMVPEPRRIAQCLSKAGAACKLEHIGCARDRMRSVLLEAHQMRSRFTILDLAILAGVMPAAADDILDAWA